MKLITGLIDSGIRTVREWFMTAKQHRWIVALTPIMLAAAGEVWRQIANGGDSIDWSLVWKAVVASAFIWIGNLYRAYSEKAGTPPIDPATIQPPAPPAEPPPVAPPDLGPNQ